MDTLKFTVPGKPAYITTVRLAVGSLASHAGFDFEDIDDIKTAVSEGCKNIACHGAAGFTEQFDVICRVEEGKIEIIFEDTCDFSKIENLAEPCRNCPNGDDIAIYVMKSLMDEIECGITEEGHKQIRMVKKI